MEIAIIIIFFVAFGGVLGVLNHWFMFPKSLNSEIKDSTWKQVK